MISISNFIRPNYNIKYYLFIQLLRSPILIPVQLTYADTHPMFTEKSFPHFYRVVPSENEFNPPRLSILRYYNWTRVGTLYQNSAKYALVCTSIKCEYTQQARHSQIVQNVLWQILQFLPKQYIDNTFFALFCNVYSSTIL